MITNIIYIYIYIITNFRTKQLPLIKIPACTNLPKNNLKFSPLFHIKRNNFNAPAKKIKRGIIFCI